MEYTIRSSYAEMPPQVMSANCDRRAIEQAQEYMLVVSTKAIPALTGTPPSEAGEIAAFAVFRDGEAIYQGVVVLKGDLGVVDSAAELVERGRHWRTAGAIPIVTGESEKYRVESPEGGVFILARDDEEAMEAACNMLLHDPDGDAYTTTPFAVYSEENGRLAGVGVQCLLGQGDSPLHSFSQPADYLLGWFNGISLTAKGGEGPARQVRG